MRVGYVRVSTPEQHTDRQISLLRAAKVEKVFQDVSSAKTPCRPQLAALMDFVREGDTVVVESISRFARNTKDLLELLERLSEKKVAFESLKERIDTTTPAGQFMLTVFAAVAQLERDFLLQRQKEGIQEAKKRGKYKGRKPIHVDQDAFQQVYNQWKAGRCTAVTAQKRLGLSPTTFYRRVRLFEEGSPLP